MNIYIHTYMVIHFPLETVLAADRRWLVNNNVSGTKNKIKRRYGANERVELRVSL